MERFGVGCSPFGIRDPSEGEVGALLNNDCLFVNLGIGEN